MDKKKIICILAALVVIVLAVLWATGVFNGKKPEEKAEEVKEAVETVAEDVKDTAEEAQEAVEGAAEDVKDAVEGAAEEVKDAVEGGDGK